MEHHYIECNCTSAEHTLRFTIDNDEECPALYVAVQLNRFHGFFERLWLAIKYVFGYECKFGHWDEVILMGDNVRKMRNLCDSHLAQWERKYEPKKTARDI